MSHQIENLSSTKKKINFNVESALVNEAFKHAYKIIRKKANLKGFRKGKIPDQVLEKYYGPDLKMESLNFVIEKTYPHALEENKVVPLIEPKFDFKTIHQDQNFEYSVELEVKPEFEVDDYKGIKIKKIEVKVKDEAINHELDHLRQAHSELKNVEDDIALGEGLVATIDFVGSIDGTPFEGGKAENYILEYGKGHFLKDFEDQIKGMKKDEVRTIEVKFPDDYFSKELQGQLAQFVVTLQALHQKELPQLDDDFAKDLGKDNLNDLKKEIEKKLIDSQERMNEQEYAKQAMEHLIKKNKFDIPEGVLKLEMEEGKKEKEDAEKSIRGQFILEEIAKKEKIKVEPEEIETRFSELARAYQQPVQMIKNYYQQNRMIPQLAGQIMLQKTLDFVVKNATLK